MRNLMLRVRLLGAGCAAVVVLAAWALLDVVAFYLPTNSPVLEPTPILDIPFGLPGAILFALPAVSLLGLFLAPGLRGRSALRMTIYLSVSSLVAVLALLAVAAANAYFINSDGDTYESATAVSGAAWLVTRGLPIYLVLLLISVGWVALTRLLTATFSRRRLLGPLAALAASVAVVLGMRAAALAIAPTNSVVFTIRFISCFEDHERCDPLNRVESVVGALGAAGIHDFEIAEIRSPLMTYLATSAADAPRIPDLLAQTPARVVGQRSSPHRIRMTSARSKASRPLDQPE